MTREEDRPMANDNLGSLVNVSVLVSSDVVAAEVRDRRPDALALFGALSAEQRAGLVHDAWTIGLRALGNAHAAAQEARLQDIGGELVAEIDRQLRQHVEAQQETVARVMGRFFDPKDGQVTQRLDAFVDDQGVLARLLDRYLAPQNSVLAQALARQVGETSPLFKRLSPTDSEGLVKVLEAQLRAVMSEGHTELARALDPLAEDGAMARLLRSLREELKGAEDDRAKQLSAALASLDANNEQSLLSRLVRETQRARADVLAAVNPDAPESPMAILKASLTALLETQGDQQVELARRQEGRQDQFEKDVRDALVRIETRRTLDQKSPRGGLDFEGAVVDYLAAASRGAPCALDVTGATPGLGRCRKGDAVLRFTAESAYAGAGVVFEAKREHGYTPQKALDELDAARKNRDAVVGVFVLARSHAGEGFPAFARYGSNVLVTWDDGDPATDPFFQAAILLGMALVTRAKALVDASDITALRDVETRIEGELGRLEKMEKHNDGVRRGWEGMTEEIRKARRALDHLLRDARSTLRALNIELQEEEVERGSPISLSADAFEPSLLAPPHNDVAG
jgi:hypothetical protein